MNLLTHGIQMAKQKYATSMQRVMCLQVQTSTSDLPSSTLPHFIPTECFKVDFTLKTANPVSSI